MSHRVHVSLNAYFLCKWKRLWAFCYAHFCHIKCFSYKTIHEEYFPTKKRQLPCRARETRAHSYVRTYRSARMVLYIKYALFLLIDRSMCIIQNLDVSIKCIANYHILYIGQLEIRLSVENTAGRYPWCRRKSWEPVVYMSGMSYCN